MTETTSVTWLTQEAYDRLRAELYHLSGAGRTELAKKIEEARIRQLRQLLENAQVGEAPVSTDGNLLPGMVVTVELAGDTETFLLGSREIAGDTDLDVYSEKSPLGAAILGHKVGEKVSYTAPNGREIPVVIVSAKPFTG